MQMPYLTEISAMLALGRAARGQGSLEYIMMLSAVSVVIVIALAMVTQLKGVAVHAFTNGTNQSIVTQMSRQLSNLANSAA